MVVRLAFLLLCLAGLCISEASWDYMLFAQQWAPGVCSTKHQKPCQIPENSTTGFTIHGGWPSYNDRYGPHFCNHSYPFDEHEVQDLVQTMESYWPSLYGPNSKFWSHEWNKHGTCAAELDALSSEHRYFQFVLLLRKRYDLKASLANANIIPGSKAYQLGDLEQAVKSDFGVTPRFTCVHTNDQNEGQVLTGAGLCFSPQLNITECLDSVKMTCDQDTPILFLPHHNYD